MPTYQILSGRKSAGCCGIIRMSCTAEWSLPAHLILQRYGKDLSIPGSDDVG